MKIQNNYNNQKNFSFGNFWSISTTNKDVRHFLKGVKSDNYRLDFIVEPKGTRRILALVSDGLEREHLDAFYTFRDGKEGRLDKLAAKIFDYRKEIFREKKPIDVKSLDELKSLIPGFVKN